MSKTSGKMVATKNKNKVIPCSTPERRVESPSRDSDSLCDSEGTSPVPFLCTQDGIEGDTDVVWNYYTPKSANNTKSIIKNSTPISRKVKKHLRPKQVEHIPKRKVVKTRHIDQKTEFLKELLELNQKLPELLAKPKSISLDNALSASDDDNFQNPLDYSPKSGIRNSSRCLRKNVLSSKFSKIDTETAIDSDDSINECLLKASQMVEEKLVDCRPTSPKRVCYGSHKDFNLNMDTKIEQDSMDAILNTIKLESPVIRNIKKFESPKLVNDSFDSFVGNLDDSALEQLTQMPIKSSLSAQKIKPQLCEPVCKDNSPSSKLLFSRFSSMPESPTVMESNNKPSTSGMVFGRYNSMPYDQNTAVTVDGDSPIRCTPDEIKRKHQQAREKLLAKRQLPFTSSQSSIMSLPEDNSHKTKSVKFQVKIPSSLSSKPSMSSAYSSEQKPNIDIKLVIEKKRQEALMKLRRRQPK